MRLVHVLIAAASVAVGSWVGLGPPRPAPPSASASVAPGAPALDPEGTHALPAPIDYASMPAILPWPRTNPEASIAKAWRLAEGPHRAPADRRRLVTLTFDDGPSPTTTQRVLELLDQYDVRATFFVLGRYLDGPSARARASRAVLRDVAARGHLIGNHTHDHELLTAISQTQVLEQIDRGMASIERTIGKRPLLFRPPYGRLDAFGEEAVRARGLDLLLWNVEAQDMVRTDHEEMVADLVRQLSYSEGGVVLLHDVRASSARVLRDLLAHLHARRYDPERPEREGYEIVDLPTYLRAVDASPPQRGARERSRAKATAKRPVEAKAGPSEAPARRARTDRGATSRDR